MTVTQIRKQDKIAVAKWSELEDRAPTYALVAGVDLVLLRYDDEVSVLYGRCLHRGALMADARVEGDNLICGVHGWDYRYDTGVSQRRPELGWTSSSRRDGSRSGASPSAASSAIATSTRSLHSASSKAFELKKISR